MSNNSNLFYQLYSTRNNIVNSGYTCTSAVDEEDTSFDISASSLGASGSITDSNGNTLSSISLDQLHAAGITQYNTETRIIQPYSCCLLQGQEYGLACASYYFWIPERVKKVKNYEQYVSLDFDVIYNNFNPQVYHIHVQANGEDSFIDLVNDALEDGNTEVVVSLQEIADPSGKKHEYLVFTSQVEGYFYYINNLRLTPAFQSPEYPDSPFAKTLSGLKVIILDFIEQFHPMKKKECDHFGECYKDENEYNEDTYTVDCDLYKWILCNYQQAVDSLDKFKKGLELLNSITPETTEAQLEEILIKFNNLIKNTPYDADLFNDYDLKNMEIIASIIESIKGLIEETNEYYQDIYWLIENRHLRIPLMKYPNGAFRGIVLIPDWPTNNSNDYQYSSIWVNHVKSQVTIYRPTKQGQYLPKVFGVLSNATLMSEQDNFKSENPQFGCIQSNTSLCHHVENGWNDILNTDYIDPYRPENSIYEDTVYMGQNCYAKKENIIGLFRYMQYVNENQLWNKVGQGYIIIGNPDDPQSKDFNLPTSLLIYNPNPVQIRIKYLIFS